MTPRRGLSTWKSTGILAALVPLLLAPAFIGCSPKPDVPLGATTPTVAKQHQARASGASLGDAIAQPSPTRNTSTPNTAVVPTPGTGALRADAYPSDNGEDPMAAPAASIALQTPAPPSSTKAVAARLHAPDLTATAPPWPVADGPPDRITAPAIGLDAPVVEVGWRLVEQNGQTVSEWEVADYAAGFHRGSAYPGHTGNTVLSGHHNVRGEVFRNLVKLQADDLITLYVEDHEFQYTVSQVFVIPEKYASPQQRLENAKWIGYFPDARLTLVTCWPYLSNTHRVIVTAYPVETES